MEHPDGSLSQVENVVSVKRRDDTDDKGLFDRLLENLGGFGRYQKLLIVLVILPSFFALSFIQSTWLFVTAAPQEHWCKTGLEANLTKADQMSILPRTDPSCARYDVDYPDLLNTSVTLSVFLQQWNSTSKTFPVRSCDSGWNFDSEQGEKGIAEEWNLVCHQSFLPTLGYVISGVGGAVGLGLGGYFSDTYGRKISYFVFFFVLIAFGIATAFSPSYPVFVTLMTLQTVATNPLYSIPYTIGVELISPKYRATFAVLLTVCFTAGRLSFTGVAYLVRNWRTLVLVSTAPFGAFFAYWFWLPESPRWLLSRRHYKDAKILMQSIAKVNKKDFNEASESVYHDLLEYHENIKSTKEKGASCWHLLEGPNTRRKLFLQMYLSCNVAVCYVGLNFYAPSLGRDPYLGFFLSSVIELPGSLLTQLIADRLGRRLTIITCLLFGCAASLGTTAIPEGENFAAGFLAVFLVAKLFMTSAYTVQELMIYEAFPTEIRSKGVAATTMVSYVISSFGPLITHFRSFGMALPMVIFAGLTVGGVICVLLLPETLNCPLPETVEEAEKMGKGRKWQDMWQFFPTKNDLNKAENV